MKSISGKFFLSSLMIGLMIAVPIRTQATAGINPAGATEIHQSLMRLKVTGSALYIAAHPDDENTRVLAWLSRGEMIRTGYLSLTRGDGGQNLLGTESGQMLGVLRTQELLAARRIDGVTQFFTRAIDFGYSKSADETFTKWDREQILGDMVRVIRTFRPDVMIMRFSKERGGHGHHMASALLAEEAFHAAGNPAFFPEQLKTLQPWQPKRLVWDAWRTEKAAIKVDVGAFNPVIGESYEELSARSRSMHKSQGFGASPRHGSQQNLFTHITGDSARTSLFEDIDLSLDRIWPRGDGNSRVDQIIAKFDPGYPQQIIPDLINLKNDLTALPAGYWREIKLSEIDNLIIMCSGIWAESTVSRAVAAPGDSISVNTLMINRAGNNVTLRAIHLLSTQNADTSLNVPLAQNESVNIRFPVRIPENEVFTSPYWLVHENNGTMFSIGETDNIVNAQNQPVFYTRIDFLIENAVVDLLIPVVYRWNDAIKGERQRPFAVLPPVSVGFESKTQVFTNSRAHELVTTVRAVGTAISGELSLNLPEGWEVSPVVVPFRLEDGAEERVTFTVTPSGRARSGIGRVRAQIGGKDYSQQISEIDYDHIAPQTVLSPATSQFVKLDLLVTNQKIGYIMGSGDEIPDALAQLGYSVSLLSDDDLEKSDLSAYQTIVCGVRAFNTRSALTRLQDRLIDYVANGGTWIVQHNTRFGNRVDHIGPIPFSTTGRDRISEEDAKITILAPDHPLMNYPNKITEKDFSGWVQERGLYFADSWDLRFTPILSGNDTGEPAKSGGLLYATYGKGVFIFTGYSWFRQLPAGVPGAYRIFVNLVSAKNQSK